MRSWALVAAVALMAGCIQIEVGGPLTAPEELPTGAAYTGPVVDFTWAPAKPRVGQEVAFTPVVKVLKGTGITSFGWSFGDGTSSTKGDARHTYFSAGVKTVTLTVRSSDGLAGQASHVVPVSSPDPSGPSDGGQPSGQADAAAAVPDPVIATVVDGRTVGFSFTWPAEPESVGWDFGDGTSSNDPAPEHEYALDGEYEVALHVLRDGYVRSAVAKVIAGTPYSFVERVVTPAVSYFNDLYEPTIEVSGTGAVYITGHTILVDTTGAPAFVSHDDGLTWRQMPFASDVALPEPLPGATPPPSDEMFLVAGDDGWVYGVDITLATFPVNAWSHDGTELRYHNPNAYDETDLASCTGNLPIKDRPWGAYAAGTLLMVNNQGGSKLQIGVLRVPPELPAGVGTGQVQWNLCAGPGGWIPGIPDMRPDGLFAVPQLSNDDGLNVLLGNVADVRAIRVVEAFPIETGGEITSVYGITAFDANGTLFVGISNNTDAGEGWGQLRFAASTDGGESFIERTIVTGDEPVRHFYMDANDWGRGALVVWAVEDGDAYDWFTAHLQLGADGGPTLQNILLAIDDGPQPSAHVTGAAVGPDGRAYLAMYDGNGILGTPLSVYVQQDGPRLPATPRLA